MRVTVADIFPTWSGDFEGVVPWMYVDVLNLVTVAIGNLVDPVELALDLPFLTAAGIPATRAEIRAAWQAVKNTPVIDVPAVDARGKRLLDAEGRPAFKKMHSGAHYGHRSVEGLTSLRLTAEGVATVVGRKMRQNDAALIKRFPDFEEWPGVAQLATHSMSWACGAGFKFPKLEAALLERDFETAAKECHMREDGNPGLVPRNIANKILYRNAAKVQAWHLDPDALFLTELGPAPPVPSELEAGSGPIIHPLSYP